MSYTTTLTNNNLNTLLTNYHNTTFNSKTLEFYLPNIKKVIYVLYSHKIKTLNIDDCFQISMTLLQPKYTFDYIKDFTNYLFFTLKQSPDFITH